jgi:putative tributyrin esterase
MFESNRVMPALYQCCGTEDFLYQDNLRFRQFAKKLSLDLTYEEDPAIHEWGYCDEKIQKVLQWLPILGGDSFNTTRK